MISILATSSVALGAVPPPTLAPGLESLRAGRLQEAGARFEGIAARFPAEPEGPFFQAFQLWWSLVEGTDDETALRVRMEEHLEEAARRARSLAEASDRTSSLRGLVFTGASLLLEAQSKAARGAHFSAASDARQGHRALRRALDIEPGMPDALFAMGAYDYYADKLPLLVKGIRFLLFIPGGNDRRGIAELEQAAAHSDLFGTESLVLLAHIYSGAYEEDYTRALGYVERAVARHPRSPMIVLAKAEALYNLGRFEESSEQTRRALTMAEQPGFPVELSRLARFRLAQCALASQDPLGALDAMETALEASPPDREAEAIEWLTLMSAAARDAGAGNRAAVWLPRLPLPDDEARELRRRALSSRDDPVAPPRARALALLAEGRLADARQAIETLLARHAGDPRLRYDIGRILQEQGDVEHAKAHLEAAARDAHPQLAGWAMIRLGWAMERAGDREGALHWYRRAAELKRFPFRSVARDRLIHPCTLQPEG